MKLTDRAFNDLFMHSVVSCVRSCAFSERAVKPRGEWGGGNEKRFFSRGFAARSLARAPQQNCRLRRLITSVRRERFDCIH